MPSLRPAFIFCSLLGSAFAAGDPVGENALMEGRAAIAARGNETVGILLQPRDAAVPAPSASAPAVAYLPAPGSAALSQQNAPGLVASHLESAPQVGGIALDEPAAVSEPNTTLVIEAVTASAVSASAAAGGAEPSAGVKEFSTPAAPIVALAAPVSVAPQPAVPSPPLGWIEPALPPADLLTIPGQDGVITLGVEPISADRAQNPFDVRYVAAGVTSDLVLDLRSLVLRVGPESQDRSVAFLNGRPLMRGDRVGGLFTLASIRLREVILERAGKFYLIPTGRITTVRLAN